MFGFLEAGGAKKLRYDPKIESHEIKQIVK
jgi:hypothetical protein